MRLYWGLALALAILAFSAAPLAAQSPGEWHVQSWASGAVPPGAAIAVQPAGADERAQDAADAASAALAAQGFVVADNAELVLRVHLEDGTPPPQSDPRFGPGARIPSSSDTKVELESQLQSNRARTDVRRVGIQFYLFKRGHAPIWTATISAPRATRDPDAQLAQLTNEAMRYFGVEAHKTFKP